MDSIARTQTLVHRLDRIELGMCRAAGRIAGHRALLGLFRLVSRLGNGIFWYLLMAALALSGTAGQVAAAHMAVTGLIGLAVYRFLKGALSRERPFIACAGVRCADRPLDRYSFPSGHTLHAVGFSIVALAYFPFLSLLLVPFTVLTGLSRVILGLHYPSDVAAGALIGAGLAHLILLF